MRHILLDFAYTLLKACPKLNATCTLFFPTLPSTICYTFHSHTFTNTFGNKKCAIFYYTLATLYFTILYKACPKGNIKICVRISTQSQAYVNDWS